MHEEKENMNVEAGSFRDKKMGGKRTTFKKKVCKFCAQKIEPDYKNPEMLRRCTTERGKILPARITGTCAKHQRALTQEIKRARVLAYLPYDKQ
ncbi:MAG: 30S ribosomal protein S18 [Spirochaetales bacterium]|nr:30S ribosomal protein S18 [Spirochaetales bacterium]MBR1583686.1 30S ribosomal protein S18 [Spirochaetales bacterium]MBR4120850.1 30S ribosomal protein S18 [Spirochaetales bacterium]MBR5669224.1 30S ribosomal protein S18 [Spirochaetales bacterium]